MTLPAIEKLLERNRPWQLELLNSFVSILEAAPAVSDVLVRGSFADGSADRSSDLDTVIAVRATDYPAFLTVLDPLMKAEFATLFPGWPDSMVGDMGGQGFVYLAQLNGALCQLDVYVTTEDHVPEIVRNGATHLVNKPGGDADASRPSRAPLEPDIAAVPALTAEDFIVEILVVFYMLRKRVLRGQPMIVYGQTYMLNDALRRLIKWSFAAHSPHWGWYGLRQDLQPYAGGRSSLAALEALIAKGALRDRQDLQFCFDRIMDIISHAAPETEVSLRQQIESYRHFLALR